MSPLSSIFLLQAATLEEFRTVFYPAISESLQYFGPELQVAFAALLILLVDLCIPVSWSKHLAWLAVGACILPCFDIGHHYEHSESLFLGMVAIDPFANFFKYFFLLGSIPVIVLSFVSETLQGRRMGEYYAILLSSVLGGMLMASATHFLMLFLGLELISIASYVLVGYFRSDRRSAEASLKYIIYGSVAAAFMAFGFSLWFGLTGSGEISSLANVLWNPEHAIYTEAAMQQRTAFAAVSALLLIFLGFAYKMSTIPMHFWAPDVYEGAPTTITAFLSVLSKGAGFAITLRFLQSLVASTNSLAPGAQAVALWQGLDWTLILIVISILTMSLGNLAALWQTNLKRLMAYSSIAHAGYLMMGLTLLGQNVEYGGIAVIAFYLLAYLGMTLGVFAVILLMENKTHSAELTDWRGMGWRAPFLGAALTVFVFSLIGIPPTAGFVGKFQLFMGVLDAAPGKSAYYVLAGAALINTAISAYYYLKIVKTLYFEGGGEGASFSFPALGKLVVLAMLILTFYLFFRADALLESTLNLKMHV
jgi:NADH-quinone oxidoreductase subunit N